MITCVNAAGLGFGGAHLWLLVGGVIPTVELGAYRAGRGMLERGGVDSSLIIYNT